LLATRPFLAFFCLCTLAHAQTPSPDQVYSFDPTVVHSPVPIQAPESEMPDQARRQQLDGLCILNIVVDRNGIPQNPRIVRCTDPIFAENSLKAVKKYRFMPATTVAANKRVLFTMHIEISYRFGADPNPVHLPRPDIKIGFLVKSGPSQSGPDKTGIYALSHDFDAPNSFPKLLRFANAGFGRAAFSLEDGAGCTATLTIDETGRPTDAQIIKCDDPSLENPALRTLWKSQFSPAILNGKPVPVRAAIHLVCDGFEQPIAP
jgi:hypothetical protein